MNPNSRFWILLSFLACLVLAIGAPALIAQEEEKKPEETPPAEPAQPEEEAPPGLDKLAAVHGGVVQATQEFMIETVFQIDGIRLFLYDKQAKPLSMKDVTAHAKIEFADATREPVELDLAYQEAAPAEGKAEGAQPATPAEPPKEGEEGQPAEPAVPPKEGEGEQKGIAPPQDSRRRRPPSRSCSSSRPSSSRRRCRRARLRRCLRTSRRLPRTRHPRSGPGHGTLWPGPPPFPGAPYL